MAAQWTTGAGEAVAKICGVAVAEGIDGPWVVPNLAGGIQLRCIRLVTLSGFGALRKDTEG
jgi:hypothetical protein